MIDNSEQTLAIAVEEPAWLLGNSPGLAYELRRLSSCARRRLRHLAIVRARFGQRLGVKAVAGIGRSSRGERQRKRMTRMVAWLRSGMSVDRSLGDDGDCQPSGTSG
jgi:hypothetical protein